MTGAQPSVGAFPAGGVALSVPGWSRALVLVMNTDRAQLDQEGPDT
jgi:hypothetical protein